MSVAHEVEAANAKYAASFTKGDLALPPQRYVLFEHLGSDSSFSFAILSSFLMECI